jgi:hypothetical protein
VLILFAHIFFHIAAFSCSSFQASPSASPSTSPSAETDNSDVKFNFGIWEAEVDNQCQDYDSADIDIDAPLKLARAAGVLGSISGFGFLFWGISLLFVQYSKRSLDTVALGMTSMGIFCTTFYLTLLTDFCTRKTDPYNCSPAGPGYMALASFIFWAAASLMLIYVEMKPLVQRRSSSAASSELPQASATTAAPPPTQGGTQPSYYQETVQAGTSNSANGTPPPRMFRPGAGNTTEIETVIHPDGSQTKTTTKTTIQPDGSKLTVQTIDLASTRTTKNNRNPKEPETQPSVMQQQNFTGIQPPHYQNTRHMGTQMMMTPTMKVTI